MDGSFETDTVSGCGDRHRAAGWQLSRVKTREGRKRNSPIANKEVAATEAGETGRAHAIIASKW